MSQADLEKAYTEAVDQLARAVEANRLLMERLTAYEIQIAEARSIADELRGLSSHKFEVERIIAALAYRPGPSHTEEPPARPGAPT